MTDWQTATPAHWRSATMISVSLLLILLLPSNLYPNHESQMSLQVAIRDAPTLSLSPIVSCRACHIVSPMWHRNDSTTSTGCILQRKRLRRCLWRNIFRRRTLDIIVGAQQGTLRLQSLQAVLYLLRAM